MFKKIVILASILFATQSYASIVYDCKFYQSATPSGLNKPKTPYDFKIVSDNESKQHYLVGSEGSTKLVKIDGLNAVSFIEITEIGNVMVTTITNGGQAVHSRNSSIFGELTPSQYYGSCSIK